MSFEYWERDRGTLLFKFTRFDDSDDARRIAFCELSTLYDELRTPRY